MCVKIRLRNTLYLCLLTLLLCVTACTGPDSTVRDPEVAERPTAVDTAATVSDPTVSYSPTAQATEIAVTASRLANNPTPTATGGVDKTAEAEPTSVNSPTPSPSSTVTPTSAPLHTPEFSRLVSEDGAVPTPVPEFDVPDDTTTVMLLGNDGGVNTDTIIVVAINRSGPTASMLSIPRDLYVYIPDHGMGRINTAVARGGPELLKKTIQYNFGVPIHFFAQIDFDGFKEVVNAVNGVEIAVSCRLQDWRLKSPELDPEEEDNWEQFALEPGVYEMDGDLALWYARSRKTTSDFDRGRRQQQLLRAMFNRAVDIGMIAEFPTLWNTYKDYVATDMDIGRILQIATLAPAVRSNGVQHLYLAGKTESFTTPDGSNVQLPVWEGERKMKEEFSRLFLPPALNMAAQPPVEVEIVNASGNPDLTALAIDNLAWFGFTPIVADPTATNGQPEIVSETSLSYYRPNFKGSFDWLISWIFALRRDEIELVQDENFPHDYRLVIGQDYDPCRPQMLAPQVFLTQQNP